MGILCLVVFEKMFFYEFVLWGELGVVVMYFDGCYVFIILKVKLLFYYIFIFIIMNYIWNDDIECVLWFFDIKFFKFINCF